MRQRIAQYLLDHQTQIRTLEQAALLGAAGGLADAQTRGLSGESLAVFVGIAAVRGCIPIVQGWCEASVTSK